MFSSLFDICLIVLQLNGPLVFFGKRKDVEACRESHILVWHIHDLWRSSVRWFLNLTFKFSWICLIVYEKTKQNIQIISIFISVWVKYNLNSMNTLHLQYKQPQSCCWLHSYPDVFFHHPSKHKQNTGREKVHKQQGWRQFWEDHQEKFIQELPEDDVIVSRATTHKHIFRKEATNVSFLILSQSWTTDIRKRLTWTVPQWSKVLFSDEIIFCFSF